MEPAPTQSGVRLSSLALAGIIILGVLFGCLIGAMIGGAGGFLGGRSMEARNVVIAQQRANDLDRQLREAQSQRPAAPASPAAPGAGAPPRATAPASGVAPTRPPQGGAAPGAGGTAPPPTRIPTVFLGVRYNILTPEIAAQVGLTVTNGALIGEVVPGSPAEKAGLLPDDIITDIDGKPLAENFTLADAVAAKKPGDALKMKVFRDGKTIDLTATLVAPPSGTPSPGVPAAPGAPPAATPRSPAAPPSATPRPPGATPRPPGAAPQATPSRPPGGQAPDRTIPAPGGPSSTAPTGPLPYLGVTVAPVTQAVARASGLRQPSGVMIESVMPASPAFQAGLFDGDIILAVDGRAVDDTHPLATLVAARKPGDKTTLRAIRNGKEEDVVVVLGATRGDSNQTRPAAP